ncbi:hypothetical protein XBFM1_1730005 [Xenorhabdus bovienii str. feltiae Moldova]|uniref:Uncharacterized protein n=2 Tax=Xenorhabdus bovienii TaxID=40576 RepID=A0A0B6XA94_XENBV|nr:hypothetical protein XBFM1_1730005 [Xenorhabdus bovienii str. feltiae Moldova]CDM89214.1 protein of unknown function [Xenorhabdus bovienii]
MMGDQIGSWLRGYDYPQTRYLQRHLLQKKPDQVLMWNTHLIENRQH